MSEFTLLTQPHTSRFNGHEVLHQRVQGLQIGSRLIRAASANGLTDEILQRGGVRYDMEGPDERLDRLAKFFIATQVEGKGRGYTGNSFVSYVMGWSRTVNEDNVRNTGNEGMEGPKLRGCEPLGVVKKTGRVYENVRGSHRQSLLGIDGSTQALCVPARNTPLIVIRIPDALKCFGGNSLFALRENT